MLSENVSQKKTSMVKHMKLVERNDKEITT
jgi:hypothetical protein